MGCLQAVNFPTCCGTSHVSSSGSLSSCFHNAFEWSFVLYNGWKNSQLSKDTSSIIRIKIHKIFKTYILRVSAAILECVSACLWIRLSLLQYNGPFESVVITTTKTYLCLWVVCRHVLANWQRVKNTFNAYKIGSKNWLSYAARYV